MLKLTVNTDNSGRNKTKKLVIIVPRGGPGAIKTIYVDMLFEIPSNVSYAAA